MEQLFYYMPPKKAKKTQQMSAKTQVFFVKTELQDILLQLLVNHFILFLLIYFSEIINS